MSSKVILANSITLTPGTITLDIESVVGRSPFMESAKIREGLTNMTFESLV